jgi:lysophospholipase L1-like esterase
MCLVQRVWTVLLLLCTAVVAVGVVYVVRQHDDIPQAGVALGYSEPAGAASHDPTQQSPSTSAAPLKVVFLGDDYTTGAGASAPKAGWTAQVATALKLDATTVGEAGAGYAQTGVDDTAYQALVDKAVAAHPDVVVVSGGRNDVDIPAARLRGAARQLFATLHTRLPDARLIAIAPWWGDSKHPSKLTKVDVAVQAGVEAAGGTYLNVADALVDHPDWMADQADPNDRGYRAIATSLVAPLQAQLPR